tara:strand:- start:241 stop:357 length:117 start_codon:yes stop_codon:yes gene_type:complete
VQTLFIQLDEVGLDPGFFFGEQVPQAPEANRGIPEALE